MPPKYTISVQYWLDRQWRSTSIGDIETKEQAEIAFKHFTREDDWQLLGWGQTPLGYPEAVFHKTGEEGGIELYRVMMVPVTSIHDIIAQRSAGESPIE